MKLLVIGSGAREHALIWKLKQSKKAEKIYCCPGNAGTSQIAENVNISVENIEELLQFAIDKKVDMTIVGPENPLVLGIADRFKEKGLKIFAPSQKAAMLEGSKIFSKEFMMRHEVPTAYYQKYTSAEKAISELNDFELPLVIKADGLAAGKGVVICQTQDEAKTAIRQMLEEDKFGEAGNQIIIEEFLEGTETSLLCFVAGKSIIPMESARDYKKAFDNDEGLNTGGMGCFSPNSLLTPKLEKEIKTNILERTLKGILAEEMDFHGVIFIGLMMTTKGVKVLEYNVRFGDPETEVVLPRLESDLVDIFEKTISETLQPTDLKWTSQKSVTVIAASGGYPESYEKRKEISGLNSVDENIIVFHAGTKQENDKILTNGGRVLAVTALANTVEEARNLAYKNIEKISFDKMFYRKDIAL